MTKRKRDAGAKRPVRIDDLLPVVLRGPRFERDWFECLAVPRTKKRFVQQLLAYAPAARPSARDALEHPYFADVVRETVGTVPLAEL